MSLLWNERRTAGEEASSGRKRRIEIILRGDDDGVWEGGVEFEYATPETIYVRPLGAREGSDIASFPPAAARRLAAVHIPPLSGIDHEEPRRDRAFQDVLVGQGRPGEVLRNLLLDVAGGSGPLVVVRVEAVFATEVPPGVDLSGNAAGLTLVKASTGLLPQALAAAGRPLVKRDFYLVAAEMFPGEIHPEVIEKLDLIASSLSPSMQSEEGS